MCFYGIIYLKLSREIFLEKFFVLAQFRQCSMTKTFMCYDVFGSVL